MTTNCVICCLLLCLSVSLSVCTDVCFCHNSWTSIFSTTDVSKGRKRCRCTPRARIPNKYAQCEAFRSRRYTDFALKCTRNWECVTSRLKMQTFPQYLPLASHTWKWKYSDKYTRAAKILATPLSICWSYNELHETDLDYDLFTNTSTK